MNSKRTPSDANHLELDALALIRARAQALRDQAAEWRKWAVEGGPSPHNLLAFTTDVKNLTDRQDVLCDIATAAATLVRLKDGSRDWSYWNEKESAWNDLRAALARLETT